MNSSLAAREDQTTPTKGGSETILIAEDEDSVRRLVSRVLERSGYRVLAAADGEEALRLFDEHEEEISLAFLNDSLSKLSGIEVKDRLHGSRPALPILVSRSEATDTTGVEIIDTDDPLLIQKPLRFGGHPRSHSRDDRGIAYAGVQLKDSGRKTDVMKKILFVDDDALVRAGLKRLLEGAGENWRLNFADSGEAALELLEAFDYDAVVADYNMPGMDGLELLESIRTATRTTDVPVVVVSGSSDRKLKRRALDAGATDLLNKPVDRDDLVARINSALRLKEYQDQIKRQNLELEERVRCRTAELESTRVELIWRLGKAGEFRDSETGHHVVRVGYYTYELAKTMGFDDEFARQLFHTSPLHDIGKIGIPDEILLKPGRLDAAEWNVMQQHTRIGATILKSNITNIDEGAPFMDEALAVLRSQRENPLVEIGANIAHYHHEKWDGSGYPLGLEGRAIPIEARITTVADVYDALSSRRPYKRSYEEEEVLDIMRKGPGNHFDPEVFEAFETSLDRLREIRLHFSDEVEDGQADVLQPIESTPSNG